MPGTTDQPGAERGNTRGGVICGHNGLCDVGALIGPHHVALLSADVEQQGVAILADVVLQRDRYLGGYLAVGFLQIRVVGGLGILGVAVQLLLFRVDVAQASSTLFIGESCGSTLQLSLERVDLLGEGVDLIFFGLVLVLNLLDSSLAFIGGKDCLLKRDESNLCGMAWGSTAAAGAAAAGAGAAAVWETPAVVINPAPSAEIRTRCDSCGLWYSFEISVSSAGRCLLQNDACPKTLLVTKL